MGAWCPAPETSLHNGGRMSAKTTLSFSKLLAQRIEELNASEDDLIVKNKHSYSRWRHGGWYVNDVTYPSGAVGCVAKYPDGKWHIVCDEREGAFEGKFTYNSRDEAADAEAQLIRDKTEVI